MKSLIKLFFVLSFSITLLSAEIAFPKLTGRVVDNASLLSKPKKDSLSKLLKEHENKTTNQVLIVTLKTLQGQEIEEYGYQLGRHWGIGQKGKDNGVLLIVAPNERKVRIEVGYGLEGVLTDKISHDIIQEKIIPYFKNQDYGKGIEVGINSILQAIDEEYKISKKTDSFSLDSYINVNFLTIMFVISVIFSFIGEFILYIIGKDKRKYAAFSGATVAFIIVYIVVADIIISLIIWVFTFFLIMLGVSSNSNGSYGSSSSSSWSGSFGGFSGGGGGFGGGGASGSW